MTLRAVLAAILGARPAPPGPLPVPPPAADARATEKTCRIRNYRPR